MRSSRSSSACWIFELTAPDKHPDLVIEMRKVCTQFGSHVVHTELDLDVRRGEILAIAGGSGSGKSVLLREMILLQRPTSGRLRLWWWYLKPVAFVKV